MKTYRVLDKELYGFIVYFARTMCYILLIVSLVFMIWPLFGMHWILIPIGFSYFAQALWGLSKKNCGRKTVKVYSDHIEIFVRKKMKAMYFEHIQFQKRSVTINVARFSTHSFECLLLYDGTDAINDEIARLKHNGNNEPFYVTLDKMENFLVIQNPEVVSLLEQIPIIQEKLHAGL